MENKSRSLSFELECKNVLVLASIEDLTNVQPDLLLLSLLLLSNWLVQSLCECISDRERDLDACDASSCQNYDVRDDGRKRRAKMYTIGF